MVKLRINVTREILEASKDCGGKSDMCAISRAIKTVFPNALTAITWMAPFGKDGKKGDIYKSILAANNLILLPKKAIEFIRKFDNAAPDERAAMQPISFEIEIPDEVLERINIDELKPLLENHPTLELV